MKPVPALVAALALIAAAGCSTDEEGAVSPLVPESSAAPAVSSAPSAPSAPAAATPTMGATLTQGLDAPWGLVALPDGSVLISQRDNAEVVRVGKDGARETVGKVSGVFPGGEGGLMGLAIAPDFDSDPAVYTYFTASGDNRIVKLPYRDGKFGDPTVILQGIKKAGIHNGGRIAFGPDGKLYAGTGDAAIKDTSQDANSLNGKILRLNPDGSVPADNPTKGSPVYSLGHRNVQGLDWDDDGNLWAAEFGQNTWDELNLIKPGANYGWPTVEGRAGREGFVDPVAQWRPSVASPSGIAVAGGSVWMAGLKGERLWQIPIVKGGRDPQTGEPKAHFEGEYGRLRTVVRTPDGDLYLTNSTTDGRGRPGDNDDRLFRVELS
ncbi:MAG: PQQ-dependent sugar dehydrogenase [Sporichthyaceae bacterium]